MVKSTQWKPANPQRYNGGRRNKENKQMQTSMTLQEFDIATHVNPKTNLAYENTLTTVENWQKLLTKYIKKGLGLPKNLCTVSLYSKSTKLRLPFYNSKKISRRLKHANWLHSKIAKIHV